MVARHFPRADGGVLRLEHLAALARVRGASPPRMARGPACRRIAAVRCWSKAGQLGLRWGLLALLTVLASPHLISSDLVLLTVTLLTFADWTVRHQEHHASAPVGVMLMLLYFAPFSGMIAARLT